jgi:hypothetical protein
MATAEEWRMGLGRPKGAKNRTPTWVRDWADERSTAILEKMDALAREGDTKAAKLILEQAHPPPKDAPITLELKKIATTQDVQLASVAVAEAMRSGSITPLQAAAVLDVLERVVKLNEGEETQKRLDALERIVSGQAQKDAGPHHGETIDNPFKRGREHASAH